MRTTRRQFTMLAGAAVFKVSAARSAPTSVLPRRPGEEARQDISLVLAPNNLGLRPPATGAQPGVWRAPGVLLDAGVNRAVDAAEVISLERPTYRFEAEAGTRIRNGNSLRSFSLQLSEKVRDIISRGRFPLVIGGDCSTLLGCLHGARLAGGRGLVHIDAHSDFSQLKNYNSDVLGAAAGMDLALASGRGEPVLTRWPQIDGPLASDADIIQVGEREAGSDAFMTDYGDILRSEITQFSTQSVLADGSKAAARRVIGKLEARSLQRAWVHVDLDVLDQKVMRAVDSPGSPGLNYRQLSGLISALCASGRIVGADFSIYDPELDPGLRYALPLVQCIRDSVRGLATGS